MGLFSKWSIQVVFITATFLYICGLFLEVMEVDSAQYAAMSMDMARTGNYLEVMYRGVDYLDKPPLVFWTASWMYQLFGVSNWAFKLPSMLFTILALISTYKLGHLLYNKRIGFVACIILLSAQATFLMNNDVRTDTLLTGSVIFAVWQIMAFLHYQHFKNLVFGFIAIGVAMLAKGPLGIMIPVLAIGSYIVGRQNYKELFKWQWLVGLAISGLVLTPMVWGLYQQFDLHPEKEILFHSQGEPIVKKDVSGVEFYFWTQSFGRLTGENVWDDGSGPFFFVHTFLWSFLPWALLAVWAILWRFFHTIRDVFKKRPKQEWLTLGGTLLPFVAMSMSHYKLPHYIWPTFPFVAIITSEFILRIAFEKPQWWKSSLTGIQLFVAVVLSLASAVLLFWAFPNPPIGLVILWAGLTLYGFYNFWVKATVNRIILSTALIALATNAVLTLHFYPNLFPYQSPAVAGKWFAENQIPVDKGFILEHESVFTLDFYSREFYPKISGSDWERLQPQECWIYVNPALLDQLDLTGYEIIEKKVLHKFHITALTAEFLNPKTREESCKDRYILHLGKTE